MSKELPYYRFTVSEWLNDDISLESYEVKGVFIDVCAWYWFKDCSIDIATLKKRFKDVTKTLEALFELGIIKVSEDGETVKIKFLDEQYDTLSNKRQKYVEAGRKGGLTRASNAQATLKQRSSYKDKDKDKDKDNYSEDFDFFWNSFHDITGRPKEDKAPAQKHWKRLTNTERDRAIKNIQPYFQSLSDHRYCKKARTYLSDKSFDNEFRVNGQPAPVNSPFV